MKEDNKGSGQSYRYSGPKKPPFTYTELIEYALCEKGELTVSGIYQWISWVFFKNINRFETFSYGIALSFCHHSIIEGIRS